MSAQPDSSAAKPPTMLTVLRNRDFLLLETNTFFGTLATEILTVAVTWMIYDRTQDPFLLGLTGLVQFLPFLCLVLLTGSVADRYSRRHIIVLCMVVEFVAILGIALVTGTSDAENGHDIVWPIMGFLALLGAGRAFYSPAAHALAPNLVKREEIGAAIACSTAVWQVCSIAGPALGGLLYGISATFAFATALVMVAIATLAPLFIRHVPQRAAGEHSMLASLFGGVRYMKAEKIVLGATTLDLFAVLFGTTVILLPVFARDILVAGPWELGLLRAAIGVGALLMALYLGLYPIRRRAGQVMFAAVAIFGIGTLVFGLSSSLILSVAALALMGASDMVSVYIREVLIQLWTPDELRGRVSAVNAVLINASNELGAFRAGAVARVIGPVEAVVLGGVCTLAVTGLWMFWFPKLRQADDLSGAEGAGNKAGD